MGAAHRTALTRETWERIAEVDADIAAICAWLDEPGREAYVYEQWIETLDILLESKRELLAGFPPP